MLLGEHEAAISDAVDAHRLNQDDVTVIAALARARIISGQSDEGIALLRRACDLDNRADVAFIYGKALCDRGRDDDFAAAGKVLQSISLAELRPEFRLTVVNQTLQCLTKSGTSSEAFLYLDRAAKTLDQAGEAIARGYLHYYLGNKEDSERHASEAILADAPGTASEAKESLARLLTLLGRPAEALPLWKGLFDMDTPTFDPGQLLNCAAGLHRDDVVLQTCERLHARGVSEWHLLDFELSYLQKYDMDAAIKRLVAFIAANPDHREAKLALSLIGLLINRSDLVRATLEDVPKLEDLPPGDVVRAVQVLKFGGRPDAAVEYAYAYLREHFENVEAHKALVMSMLPGSFSPTIPPTLDVVAQDAAVCFREPAGGSRWVVLEDTNDPRAEFEEIPFTSRLAAELIDKKVGDTVILAKGNIQDRPATILQILPKFVRRLQDSSAEMQMRFGSAASLESVRIDGTDNEAVKRSVETLVLAPVKRRAEAVDRIREIYKSSPSPLHMYGAHFGANAYTSLADLAVTQGQEVKCSQGTPAERANALQSLQTAKTVVVDITALSTLRMLGLAKVLSSAKYRFILSQGTRSALREMFSSSRMFSAPGGTLSFEAGAHVMHEHTAEDQEASNREDDEFISFVEEAAEVRSGVALAGLEPNRREMIEMGFGNYGGEAIMLSADKDNILWTDDLIQAQFAAQEFGVRRIWTQLLLGTLADDGLMSFDEYNDASARLIGMEFVATSFDASALMSGCRLAKWSMHARPAAQFIKIFSSPLADQQALFGIFIRFVVMLYRESISSDTRCSVLQSLLDALGTKSQTAALLPSLRQVATRLFGINALGQEQFSKCFDRWLAHKNQAIILPG